MNTKETVLPLCKCHGISKKTLKDYYVVLRHCLGDSAHDIMRHMLMLLKPRANMIYVCPDHVKGWFDVSKEYVNRCSDAPCEHICRRIYHTLCVHAIDVDEVKNYLKLTYNIDLR